MLRYAIFFLIIAVVAGVMGFGGLAADLAWIAKVFFVISVVLFVALLVLGRRR